MTEPVLNPRSGACIGRFGYGSGHQMTYTRMQSRLAQRIAPNVHVESYCQRCPYREQCMAATIDAVPEAERVNDGMPTDSRMDKILEANMEAGHAAWLRSMLQRYGGT